MPCLGPIHCFQPVQRRSTTSLLLKIVSTELMSHVQWIVSTIGLVPVGYATKDHSYILSGYLTDSYGPYAALGLSRPLNIHHVQLPGW